MLITGLLNETGRDEATTDRGLRSRLPTAGEKVSASLDSHLVYLPFSSPIFGSGRHYPYSLETGNPSYPAKQERVSLTLLALII